MTEVIALQTRVCRKHQRVRKLLPVGEELWANRRAWVCPECQQERLDREHRRIYGKPTKVPPKPVVEPLHAIDGGGEGEEERVHLQVWANNVIQPMNKQQRRALLHALRLSFIVR